MTPLGLPRYHFRTVTSTNDFAKEGVAKGVSEGSLYTADHQTKGRGRRGASWSDSTGASALMSFVLYPDFSLSEAWVLSFAASLATCEALQALGAPAQIKWPNDVLIGGSKIAGVLVEMVTAPSAQPAAIVGIGVNVCQDSFPSAGEYATPPISLGMAMGESVPPVERVVDEVARALARRYADCAGASADNSRERMLAAWRDHLVTGQLQKGICLSTGRSVQGTLRDVRVSDGAARLEEPDGAFTLVRPCEALPVGSDRV